MKRTFIAIFMVLAVLLGIACVFDFFVVWQHDGHPPGYRSFLELVKAPAYYSHKVFILSLSYFITQLMLMRLLDEIDIRKAERELDSTNITEELPRSAGYMFFGLIAFIEASIIFLVLSLSLLIGYRIDLPAWYFLSYGLLAGGLGFGIMFIVPLLPPKGFWTGNLLLFICFFYAVVVGLFLHVFDFYL